ncbi:coiled-coil domain-containing protein 177-like [Ptychodera flava]|uniref:coiled-coil domain-containing protein 177-like n=1 Tax=Ptychodera flava TaxID=63121 RepID=UPI00396A7F1F
MEQTVGMTVPNYNVDDFFDEPDNDDNKAEDEREGKVKRDPKLKLDLYNFESPEAEDSRYILTSPRSLEACARYGIRPVELLLKSIEDFEDEYGPLGKSQKAIQKIYEEHEQDRLTKLKICRTEREKIILEDEDKDKNGGPTAIDKYFKKYPTRTSSPSKPMYKSMEVGGGDTGSLQRKRTAWTTSIGHERVTPEELDNRARELYDLGKKKDDEDLKETRKSRSRTRTRYTNEDPFAVRDKGKSFSSTSLRPSSAASSFQGKTYQEVAAHWNSLALDQKIVNLMKAKLASEREQDQQRELARLTWDEEHRTERQKKLESEIQRRRNMAEVQRDRERKKRIVEKQRKLAELELVSDARRIVEYKEMEAERNLERQRQVETSKLLMKKQIDEQKKRQQQHLKTSKDREDDEFRDMVKHHLDYSLSKAERIKQMKEEDEHRRVQLRNKQEMEKYKSKKAELEKLSKEERLLLAESLEMKHHLASQKYATHIQQRDNEIMLSKMKKEQQVRKSKESKTAAEREMDEWRDALLEHRKMLDDIAVRKSAKVTEEKAMRAHEARSLKEKTQKKNLHRVKEDEERWKRDTEDLLIIKDSVTKRVASDRERSLERSRSAARASEDLRNRIRDEYAGGFDKMAEKARLQARIGTGVQSATKNMSTLSLG